MKLNKIFSILLSIATFTGCSNEDHPNFPEGENAVLSVSIFANSAKNTKATDGKTLEGEDYINNLTIFIFNETGEELITKEWQQVDSKDGSAQITDVKTRAAKSKILLVANTDENAFGDITNYESLQNKLAELSTQKQNNLTMSSRVIDTREALSGSHDNYIGFGEDLVNVNDIKDPLLLTRIAARVDIAEVQTNFLGTKLEGRKIRIDNISLEKAKTASFFFSETDWGKVEAGNLAELTPVAPKITVDDNTPVMNKITSFYTFENSVPEEATQLVMKVTLIGNADWKEETKYFRAIINEHGIDKGYKHNYIKRNTIYNVRISFSGNSFDGISAEGTFNAAVEVVNWGYVDQDVTID